VMMSGIEYIPLHNASTGRAQVGDPTADPADVTPN
jgi:hypothetical protein